MYYADAVFEGGGVKGIGIVGAVCALEDVGYRWKRVAGTSAGSIIASCIAAGYTGKELKRILMQLNYRSLIDEDGLNCLPFAGEAFNLFKNKGIHRGDKIEEFINTLLRAKGVSKFKDVWGEEGSRLKIIASDITKKELLVLPDDIAKYGIDPKELEIAKAVRMSISIPLYFEPYILNHEKGKSFVVDGGILSNFPIWIFDVNGIPRWPTFGFNLYDDKKTHTARGKEDIVSYLLDIMDTMIDEDELRYLRDKDFVRTININTLGVKTTEFSLSNEMAGKLFTSGYRAGVKFMSGWDFNRYIKDHRSN